MKIICIGQATYDITLPVPKPLSKDSKIKIDKQYKTYGGSAYNAASLLSKWGKKVYFAGAVGKDFYGSEIVKNSKSKNINNKYLKVLSDPTFNTPVSYIISNASEGDRSVVTVRSKITNNLDLDIEESFDIIYMDGYEKELAKKVIEKNKNAIKILDAGNVTKDVIELAKLSDYVICSKEFVSEYTNVEINPSNMNTILNSYEILKEKLDKDTIITLGEAGSFTYFNGYKLIPSIPVNVVDTTGAGDIYHAAFTYFISSGYNVTDSMRRSNVTAALSCETMDKTSINLKKAMDTFKSVL